MADEMIHDNRLPVIEAEIRDAHAACNPAAQTSIAHAIECGTLLTEAKGKLPHGQWLPWLRDKCGLSERTAQRYMRLARNSESATVADLGIAAADRMLAASGNLDFDLSHGAISFDSDHGVTILIKPVGRPGHYVGWCHIIVTRVSDADPDGTYRRTVEGVHESEIVAWLRQRGGIDVDAVTWHPGNWEPKPDTYRVDQSREATAAKGDKTGQALVKEAKGLGRGR